MLPKVFSLSLVIMAMSFFSMSVSAEDIWHQSTIQKVYPYGNGRFVIIFNEDSERCTGSGSAKYYYVAVGENGVNQQGLELMFSAALSAGMSGKKVHINFDDSTNKCYVNRLFVVF